MGDEFNISVTSQAISVLGKETVQTLQNKHKQSLCMVRKNTETISVFILPLGNWTMQMKRFRFV